MPSASSNVGSFTIRHSDLLSLLKLKSLRHSDIYWHVKQAKCAVPLYAPWNVATVIIAKVILTAYDDLEDKLKARSSTLKALVLRFSTSFDDKKPSNPCKCWWVAQIMTPQKVCRAEDNTKVTSTQKSP